MLDQLLLSNCSSRFHSPCARPVSSNHRSASPYLGMLSRELRLNPRSNGGQLRLRHCPGARLQALFQYLSTLRIVLSGSANSETWPLVLPQDAAGQLCGFLVESICSIISQVPFRLDTLGLGSGCQTSFYEIVQAPYTLKEPPVCAGNYYCGVFCLAADWADAKSPV